MIRLIFVLSVVVLSLKSFAGTVSDLAVIDGIRDNQLVGYGLVVGLDGTGDKSAFTQSSLEAYLRNNGIKLPSNVSVKSKNVAAVTVTASLPSFASVGQRLDVTVSSLGDAKSLRGGMLILTPLKGVDSNVYALAQGNLLVGGMDASGADGSKISINISSVGRIPSGATVEVPFEAKLVHEGDVTLNLKSPSFLLAGSMVDALNEDFGYPVAHAANHSKVIVKAPDAELDLVSFIGRVQSVFVSEPKDAAKVIVNSRTGTVVITETVTVSPVAITHGGITLEVKEDPEVALLNDNVEQDTDIAITNEQKRLFELKQGANLNDIVDSFNDMGLAPSDLVAILEALKSSGSLKADLEII
ncbi:flagellar basal body P-ring protein FlgI [Pseudoalteromonas marina]|uniref:Flagellar P-ring protein n=1 Tax=Pseudoalteromonas marina TaxID=267375 RepID=A0ABT9FC39_9GAMM|nr:flagellar basal body P-ring protein FlgI [Pseudoalteromonas marina]MDP2564349.1 flagellar basal body P-ring protein FlgI [Pseudoalteromonas marina]